MEKVEENKIPFRGDQGELTVVGETAYELFEHLKHFLFGLKVRWPLTVVETNTKIESFNADEELSLFFEDGGILRGDSEKIGDFILRCTIGQIARLSFLSNNAEFLRSYTSKSLSGGIRQVFISDAHFNWAENCRHPRDFNVLGFSPPANSVLVAEQVGKKTFERFDTSKNLGRSEFKRDLEYFEVAPWYLAIREDLVEHRKFEIPNVRATTLNGFLAFEADGILSEWNPNDNPSRQLALFRIFDSQ